jgi:hypothetical protein
MVYKVFLYFICLPSSQKFFLGIKKIFEEAIVPNLHPQVTPMNSYKEALSTACCQMKKTE